MAAQLGKPRLHLGIGESRIDLGVELVDDRGWRVFPRADAGPEAKLIAWHEFGHRQNVRQHRRARRGRAKFARPGVALLAFGRATSRKQCPDLLTSGRQDDGLAGRLRVEESVGFLGLLEPPAVREEPLHVHLPVGDELGALGLALLRERPRPHQRYLPAQEIRADVERDLTPLADETGGAPRRLGRFGKRRSAWGYR